MYSLVWLQNFLVFVGHSAVCWLYLKLFNPENVVDFNLFMGLKLDWTLPIRVTLFTLVYFLWIYHLYISYAIFWLFAIKSESYFNKRNTLGRSFAIFSVATLLMGLVFSILSTGFINNNKELSGFTPIDKFIQIVLQDFFKFNRTGSIIVGNTLFILIFVPIWHYKLKKWRDQ